MVAQLQRLMKSEKFTAVILGLVPRICNVLISFDVILGTGPRMTSRGCASFATYFEATANSMKIQTRQQ
ncbi:hypothetical protein G6L61_09365 [Agrobacterium fabrum]|nr:hypothetical protein At1D132_15900 [Agrobacterium fabrum]NSZ11959.1 hypothetical protein [Agrobacterium fabrum]